MATTDFDPKTLSVEERLALIDRLWISILEDAGRGDTLPTQALDMDYGLDPEVIEELERRADELERNPSEGLPWEDFLEELRRKRG